MSRHQTDITLSLSFEHSSKFIKLTLIDKIMELINGEFNEDRLDVVLVDSSWVIENSVCIDNEPPDDTHNDF